MHPKFNWNCFVFECRDSAVGIATRYGVTGWTVWGSNPGGGEIFRTRPDRSWAHPAPYSMVPGLPVGKAAGAWRWTPNPT
jgi:hypothetical protein